MCMLKIFPNELNIIAAMSEKSDGSMNLVQADQVILEHRQTFFAAIDPTRKVIAANLVHGSSIAIVDGSNPDIIANTDGLITRDANILLSITIADCVPVFFYEPEQKIVGLVHSGWRGTVAGIVDKAVESVISLGGNVTNLQVALGPGINACHFEIQSDVLEKFAEHIDFIEHRDGKIFVDLKGIIVKQLTNHGVKTTNIENHPDCTMEGDRYFSYRRDKPVIVETMAAVIGVRS